METSPATSAGYVSSTNPDDSVPQTHPHDTPDTTAFAPPEPDHSHVALGLDTPNEWSYPPLSLYSPSMDGCLPFDAGLETFTPSVDPQQCFTRAEFSSMSSNVVPPIDKINRNPEGMVPTATFLPYVKLFFDRLYPVFPVLEKYSLPSEGTVSDPLHRSWDRYALLTSLAAAVTEQLNIVGTSPGYQSDWSGGAFPPDETTREFYSAEYWTQQTLQARLRWDFMGDPNEATIMTSFFLFEYYGNKNCSQRAWYYLREAIGFALAIGLDDPDTYLNLDPKVSQRRCRLFWLLFITERQVYPVP